MYAFFLVSLFSKYNFAFIQWHWWENSDNSYLKEEKNQHTQKTKTNRQASQWVCECTLVCICLYPLLVVWFYKIRALRTLSRLVKGIYHNFVAHMYLTFCSYIIFKRQQQVKITITATTTVTTTTASMITYTADNDRREINSEMW